VVCFFAMFAVHSRGEGVSVLGGLSGRTSETFAFAPSGSFTLPKALSFSLAFAFTFVTGVVSGIW